MDKKQTKGASAGVTKGKAEVHVFDKAAAEELKRVNEKATGATTEVQRRIEGLCNAMRDLLLEKNRRYGSAALEPLNIFSLQNSANSIKVRLDDKLSRIKNRTTADPKANDVCDIIGYCFLLLVSLGVEPKDVLGQID